MHAKKRILLKLTGSIFIDPASGNLSTRFVSPVINQIQRLLSRHQFGIVIGGGNFFRGNTHGKILGLTPWPGHSIGMLATLMNGLLLKDLCSQASIKTSLLSAFDCSLAEPINQDTVARGLDTCSCISSAGGTGIPYFTTDTNAVIRCLQMEATELWKCTNVEGVYDRDPATHAQATLLKSLTFKQALDQHLDIMDMTSFALAHEHKLTIRILNVFNPDSLIHASEDPNFGSFIHP